MLVLGLILILLAAGATLVAVLGASTIPVDFQLGGFSLSMEPLWVFFTGAATVLLLVLGVELMRAGARRANKRRKDKKELNRLAGQAQTDRRAEPGGTTHTRTATGDDGVTGPDRPAH